MKIWMAIHFSLFPRAAIFLWTAGSLAVRSVGRRDWKLEQERNIRNSHTTIQAHYLVLHSVFWKATRILHFLCQWCRRREHAQCPEVPAWTVTPTVAPGVVYPAVTAQAGQSQSWRLKFACTRLIIENTKICLMSFIKL
jgi:hypothetical protein